MQRQIAKIREEIDSHPARGVLAFVFTQGSFSMNMCRTCTSKMTPRALVKLQKPTCSTAQMIGSNSVTVAAHSFTTQIFVRGSVIRHR